MRARMLSLCSLGTLLVLAGSGCVTVPNKSPGYNAGSTNSALNPNGTALSRFWKQQSNKLAAWGKPKPTQPDQEPPGAEFYVVMGQAQENAGNAAKAEEFYQKALAADSKSLLALTAYAHFEDRRDHLESATKYYKRAIARYPEEAGVYNDLALCYQRRGMLDESAAMLSKATDLQPKKALFHNNLAAVLVDSGRSDEALAELLISNNEAVAHYNLGCLLHRKGDDIAAISQFQQVLAYDASMIPARQWLAKLESSESLPAGDAARIAERAHKRPTIVSQEPLSGSNIPATSGTASDPATERTPVRTVSQQTIRPIAPIAQPAPPAAEAAPSVVEAVPPVAAPPVAMAPPTAVPQTPAAPPQATVSAFPDVTSPVAIASAPLVNAPVASEPALEPLGRSEVVQQTVPGATIPLGQTYTAPEQTASAAWPAGAGVIEGLPEDRMATAEAPSSDETIEALPGTDDVSINGVTRLAQPEIDYPQYSDRSASPDGFESLPTAPLPDAPRRPARPTWQPSQIEPLPALDAAGIPVR